MPVTILKKPLQKFDQKLANDQLQALKTIYATYGLDYFCQHFIWILKKKPEAEDPIPVGHWNKRLVPFVPNDIQVDFHNRRKKRNWILKGRQFGITTDGIITCLLIPAIINPGSAGLLISQTNFYGYQHFQILNRAHRYFGKVFPFIDEHPSNEFWRQVHEHLLHTKYSARKEIVYDAIDSRILVDSAQKEEVGQGLPGISDLWCTEVARWPRNPEETMANVKESVHQDGTITGESTANMMSGYFYEEYQRAKNDPDAEFMAFFYEWFKHKEYRRTVNVLKPDELTEEEREIRSKVDLTLEQVTWRRWKTSTLRHQFKEKYPEDDISCFLLSGQSFFDQKALLSRNLELKDVKPYMISDDKTMVFFKRRIKGRRYLVAVDPATGRMVNNTDTDRTAMVCLDVETGEEVAAFADRIPPEEAAMAALEIARTYNDAMIAVERTGDGGTIMLQLEHERYANIYKHREWLREEQQVIELPGWPPTIITRPIACNRLALFVRDYTYLINDPLFVSEAYAFQRDPKKGKPQASPGAHDDRVSCRYIGHYVRLVLLGYIDPVLMRGERYGQLESEDDVA